MGFDPCPKAAQDSDLVQRTSLITGFRAAGHEPIHRLVSPFRNVSPKLSHQGSRGTATKSERFLNARLMAPAMSTGVSAGAMRFYHQLEPVETLSKISSPPPSRMLITARSCRKTMRSRLERRYR
jgi:hypothetical protein